ncbi:YDG/SRA domain-containing protein [Streptomyces sp. DSM 116496]|uniref:YDG/SRA domain-containing protein n=1 Tax=Streptomyces stoeckheimensis TaxID=3344656 RepID=UPI0038B4144D
MTSERVVGHIVGTGLGSVLRRRRDVFDAHLHSDLQRGISKLKDSDGAYVSDAIVLNGGYLDDDDSWHEILYTGASPAVDRDPQTKQLKADQSWSYADNAALKLSFERGYPIRILRGHEGDARYSPREGYRYDGLYRITQARTGTSVTPGLSGEPIAICQFVLERLPESDQEPTALESALGELAGFEEVEERVPETRTLQVQRVIRDTAAARRIKDLYGGQCQVCGIRLVGARAQPYCEGAHLKPLGAPHMGPDVEPNILCLCPNCHVRLDLGAISIGEDWSVIERVPSAGPRTTLPHILLKKGHGLHPAYATYQRDWWDSLKGGRPGK